MLSRRHIRIKVMQSLYSYLSIETEDLAVAQKSMLKHFNEVIELKFVLISLLVELVNYADSFYEEAKTKHFPTSFDLDPNRKFIDNQIIRNIQNNNKLMKEISKFSSFWLNNDHDILNKIFINVIKSDLYNRYLNSSINSIDYDKKFIVDVMNQYILNHHLVHHILEERSIYWIDDLPFIATVIFGDIKNDISMYSSEIFKDLSDKYFALNLFKGVINNNLNYDHIIIKFSENWDLNRIAKMDQLIIKMAFVEIMTMEDLPFKVTMNEYIEISKYYSTKKSRVFINGLLDNFVKTYIREGKVKKVGKGLV
tara:strand:- start:578 stop:1507 length:930 start_codon:yes stop_codon:yes gene_type:complete